MKGNFARKGAGFDKAREHPILEPSTVEAIAKLIKIPLKVKGAQSMKGTFN